MKSAVLLFLSPANRNQKNYYFFLRIQRGLNASLLSTEEKNSNPPSMVGRKIATVALGTENPLIERLPDSIKVS